MNSKAISVNDANKNKGPDAAGKIIAEFFHELVVMFGLGFSSLFRYLYRCPIPTISFLVILHLICRIVIIDNYHISFFRDLAPEYLTLKRVHGWFRPIPFWVQVNILYSFLLTLLLVPLGMHMRWIRTKYQKIFLSIGLTNGERLTPVLASMHKIDRFKKKFVFDCKNIGKSEFEDKKERLEAAFQMALESVEYGKTQRFISLTFTKDILPKRVTFFELLNNCSLKEDEFIVGKSAHGVVKQSIAELPHMLIAGSTGAGKSVYFKQTLVGLLKSTPKLQLYIVDLKRGLEAVDFKAAPNVTIIKTMQEAVSLLTKINKKMETRFDYLEKNGKKEIIPQRDNMERIIVAVDESSVLHMKRDKSDPDYDLAIQARILIDSISKLSRAAAINLILATQKIDKETIPTTVQENITGRMAFRANTLHGSLVVLGNKDALDLPEIAGRGMWKVGSRQVIVQAPYISEEDVKNTANEIERMYESGERKLTESLLHSNNSVPTQRTEMSLEEVRRVKENE